MFNTILDQLLIGNEAHLISATQYKLCYSVNDLYIQLNRDKDGNITSANISPIERRNYDRVRKSTSSKTLFNPIYSKHYPE